MICLFWECTPTLTRRFRDLGLPVTVMTLRELDYRIHWTKRSVAQFVVSVYTPSCHQHVGCGQFRQPTLALYGRGRNLSRMNVPGPVLLRMNCVLSTGRLLANRRLSLLAGLVVATCLLSVLPPNTHSVLGAGPSMPAHAGILCGRLVADTVWTADAGPYQMTCNVTVDTHVTLRIQPGVLVIARPGTALHVKGNLQSTGSSTQHIVFQSATSWNGIRFYDGSDPSSTIGYTEIDNATGTALTDYPGVLLAHDTNPV